MRDQIPEGWLNNVIQGDCLALMAKLPDKCVDLTVTSPPYDNLRNYAETFTGLDWKPIIKELFRITKISGVVVWVVGDQTVNGSETGTSFKQALWAMECGFRLHDTMIYETDKPPIVNNRYQPCFEYMFIFSSGRLNTFNPIKKSRVRYDNMTKKTFTRDRNGVFRENNWVQAAEVLKTNIWYFASSLGGGSNDRESFQHPATYPENLAKDHIYSWSNAGALVLDPFMGSGTTGKMAVKMDRNFIGFEIEPKYVEIAKKRIQAEKNQLKLF